MLYILDGSGFLFRAYYSLPSIKDKNGNEAGAIFGFYKMLLKLLQNKPDNFIIVFDPGKKTKRSEMLASYKANRKEIEDDFKQQIPKIIDIAKQIGVDVEIIPEYEADDVIASIVKNYKGEKVVVSSDKDLKQLIDEKTMFLEPKKMDLIDKEKFKKEYGFEPSGMVLYLALLGDSSDNIPGIKGIGKKTAAEIVQKYPTYEELVKNIENLPEKIKSKLSGHLEQLEDNIKLIQLMTPGEFKSDEIKEKSKISNIDFHKLKTILVDEYGFKSFDKGIIKLSSELKQPIQASLF